MLVHGPASAAISNWTYHKAGDSWAYSTQVDHLTNTAYVSTLYGVVEYKISDAESSQIMQEYKVLWSQYGDSVPVGDSTKAGPAAAAVIGVIIAAIGIGVTAYYGELAYREGCLQTTASRDANEYSRAANYACHLQTTVRHVVVNGQWQRQVCTAAPTFVNTNDSTCGVASINFTGCTSAVAGTCH